MYAQCRKIHYFRFHRLHGKQTKICLSHSLVYINTIIGTIRVGHGPFTKTCVKRRRCGRCAAAAAADARVYERLLSSLTARRRPHHRHRSLVPHPDRRGFFFLFSLSLQSVTTPLLRRRRRCLGLRREEKKPRTRRVYVYTYVRVYYAYTYVHVLHVL